MVAQDRELLNTDSLYYGSLDCILALRGTCIYIVTTSPYNSTCTEIYMTKSCWISDCRRRKYDDVKIIGNNSLSKLKFQTV